MLKTLTLFLDALSPALALLMLLILIATKHDNVGRDDVSIILFLIVQLILNLWADILYLQKTNNLFLYHTNCFFSYCILAHFYFRIAPKKSAFRKIIIFFSILFLIGFLVNLLYFQPYTEFNSNSYAISAVMITIFSLGFFRVFLIDFSEYNVYEIKEIWYSSGILLYFASSFFVFISYNYLSLFNEFVIPYIWRMHNVFLFFMCILIVKGFLCKHSIKRYS